MEKLTDSLGLLMRRRPSASLSGENIQYTSHMERQTSACRQRFEMAAMRLADENRGGVPGNQRHAATGGQMLRCCWC